MVLWERIPGGHLVRQGRSGIPELGSEGERGDLAEEPCGELS